MILRPLLVLAGLASLSAALPKFSKPSSGSSVAAGTLSIAWSDSDDTPAISSLSTYQIFLVAGGNEDAQTMVSTLVTNGQFATGNTASGSIAPGFAGVAKNAYYLKMVAVATQGGTVTVYSDRFSITGMTGIFPTAIEAAIPDSATDVPDTINSVSNAAAANNGAPAAAAGNPAATGSYAIAYNQQNGPTKFAPMPPVPATKITKNKASAQYPTSAFTIATTFLPTPVQVWTNTMSQTYSAASIENTASAAPMPTDSAMARFLERWKD